MKKNVKVLIFKNLLKNTNSEKPKEGSKLIAMPHTLNEHDKNAIALYEGKNHIGFLASSNATLTDSKEDKKYASASQVKPFFATTKKREVFLKKEIDDNKGMVYYHGELIVEEPKKKAYSSIDTTFRLVGGVTAHPNKSILMKDIKDGKKCLITIEENKNNFIGNYKGKSSGVVKEDDVKDMMRKAQNAGTKIKVTALKLDRADIICSLEILDAKAANIKSLESIIEDIVKKKIDTKKNINDKIAYMEANNATKVNMVGVFSSYVKYPKEVADKIPNPKVKYVDNDGLVRKSISYMNINKNLLYEGDRGVGKNVLTETIAWLYNRPIFEFSLNSQQSNNALLGNKTFKEKERKPVNLLQGVFNLFKMGIKTVFSRKKDDLTFEDMLSEKDAKETEEILGEFLSDKQKDIVFEKSSIVDAFEYGGIIVLDELNTALAHVMPIFNSLLDHRRRMNVPDYGMVEGHKNFCAIATQNLNYQGTFASNEATIDRFVPIVFPQCTNITEIIRANIEHPDEDALIVIESIYQGLKASVERQEVEEKAMTIRGFITACEVIEQGLSLKEALMDNVANKATDKDTREAITNMIDLQIL